MGESKKTYLSCISRRLIKTGGFYVRTDRNIKLYLHLTKNKPGIPRDPERVTSC